MKKSKLLKTGALALGTVASIAAPIAAVVSCGGMGGTLKRYNTSERSELELQTTFSKTGPQYEALSNLADEYNKEIKTAKPAGAKPVKVTHVEGGYGTVAKQLKAKFASETDAIPNMFIDYADAAGEIAFDQMSLDLKGSEGQLDEGVYTPMNEEIGRSKTADGKQKTLILPIAESTENLSIDAPLLAFLIKAAGGTLDTSGETTNAIITQAAASHDFPQDAKANTMEWKGTDNSKKEGAFTVTDEDFKSYDKLIALSDKIADSQGLAKADTRRILGLDAPANALYEIAYSKAKAKKEDFIYTKDDANDYVSYGLFEDDTKSQLFKDSMKVLIDAVNKGSTRMYGGGAYASSDETHHQLAMAIGSTAGYSHNFMVGDNAAPSIDGTNPISGDEIHIATGDAGKDGKYANNGDIVFGSYHNKVVIDDGNVGHYDKGIAAASFAALKVFLTAHKTDAYFVNGTDKPAGAKAGEFIEVKNAKGTTIGFVVLAALHVDAAVKTLQQAELYVAPAPVSASSNGAKVAFLQGPGLIGVHNNNVDDAATLAFAKWLTGTQKIPAGFQITKNVKLDTAVSPLEAWAAGSEYAVSITGNKVLGGLKTRPIANKDAKYTYGNFFTTKLIEGTQATGTDKLNLLTPPADESSAFLRTQISTAMKTAYDTYHGKGSATADAAAIYKSLKNQAHINDLF